MLSALDDGSVLTEFFDEADAYLDDRYTIADSEAVRFADCSGIESVSEDPPPSNASAEIVFSTVLALDNIAKSIPTPTAQALGHAGSIAIDLVTQDHYVRPPPPGYRADRPARPPLHRPDVGCADTAGERPEAGRRGSLFRVDRPL